VQNLLDAYALNLAEHDVAGEAQNAAYRFCLVMVIDVPIAHSFRLRSAAKLATAVMSF
jgi:hypothetical protein